MKDLRAEAAALKGEEDQGTVQWTVRPTNVADLTLEDRLLKNVWPAPLASRLLLARLGRAQTYPA